jgi:microcystin degradation protein MlrC
MSVRASPGAARIAVGGFAQESQSFSPVPGSWAHFGPHDVRRGSEMLELADGTRTELGGVLDAARERGIELVPLLMAKASSSAGVLLDGVFSAILGELVERLRQAGPVDGVLLVLHGAMVAERYDDATGEILRAVRAAIGPGVPLVGTLDLHANVTQQMVRQATALAGYHTAPHVDLYETGQRGMRLLLAAASGDASPAAALRRLPMLLPGETARTTEGPYAEVMDQARALMERAEVLDSSVFSVQPWLDVRDVGCSVLVIADGDAGLAGREADRLADAFWERRRQFDVPLTPTSEAIQRALASDRRPFVLADSADAPSSGAPGDSTVVLRALLEVEPGQDCYLNVVDPQAVDEIVRAGVGQTITVQVGARFTPAFYASLQVSGVVRLIADGAFVQKGPGFHGDVLHRGRTAVLQIGHVHLVVMERAIRQWDPEFYRSVGLEPRDAQIVVVKSPAGFRAAYEPFAAEVLIVDAAGVCSPNLRALPFKHVRRPLYPLDEIQEWRTPGVAP